MLKFKEEIVTISFFTISIKREMILKRSAYNSIIFFLV